MPRAVNPAVGVVSKSRYAEHRGCSAAYISKLIREGRLAAPALLADGKVNVALADQMLGAAAQPDLPTTPAPAPFASHRADREAAQARLARLRADELEGQRLPRDRVELRTFDLVRRLRDELLAWPDGIAPRLATMTDDRAIAELLTADLEEKLTRLSGALQDAIATNDDDPADEAAAA
jgi:hypothetical protein